MATKTEYESLWKQTNSWGARWIRGLSRLAKRKSRLSNDWVPVCGARWSSWPLVEECRSMASRNLSLSFIDYRHFLQLFFTLLILGNLVTLCLCVLVKVRSSGSRALLSHHLSPIGGQMDRRTDGRVKLAARFFLFFTRKRASSTLVAFSGRFFRLGLLDGIRLLPARIDVSRCKFVLFFTVYHPTALIPADLAAANKGFLPLFSYLSLSPFTFPDSFSRLCFSCLFSHRATVRLLHGAPRTRG